jgi:alcohol dehydrogenase class IV
MRCLVISTPGRGEMAERVKHLLGERCAGIHAEAKSHIPMEVVREAQGKIRTFGVDCMVAIGGGASIGLAKAIALETRIPFAVIPTTYSGSEMTGFCGITTDGVKRMHKSPDMIARTVIYDPELTVGLPAAVTVPSAMNALAHCVDALYVSTTSPITACAATEGLRVIILSLKKVLANPRDIGARSDLLYGAYLGGAALTGGFALQHRLAQLLGGALGLPHADAHAAVLPYVIAFNAPFAPRADARIAAAFNVDNAAAGLYDFAVSIGSPLGLQVLGMKESDIGRCTQIVIDNDNGLNPRPLERDGVRKLIECAFHGLRPDQSAM